MKEKLTKQLQVEIDTSFLYSRLSEKTEDPMVAGIYKSMSGIEMSHAAKVLEKIKDTRPDARLTEPSLRARMQVRLASVFGWGFVFSNLQGTEKMIAKNAITGRKEMGEPVNPGIMNHAAILHNISKSSSGLKGGILAKLEGRHKSMGSNALRAAVLGANDGLVTNFSLIMGVSGAAVATHGIIITGIAGLLAGAVSMALGEWLSVRSSYEMSQRQVDIETEEMENSPEEEMLELALIYQSKGIEKEKAAEMARQVFENKDTAIETLVKEELGLDSQEPGGSAWEAALTSFILFAIGASIPLLPIVFLRGFHPVQFSLGISVIGLFLLGAVTTFYTGKNFWISGLRQVVLGLLAAGAVYGIGRIVGGIVS
jgi:vacuolar iron transporter family protein